MKDTKVVFMGTPDFSVPVLKVLIEQTDVVLVVTQPDKEVGRKKVLSKSPIKQVAEENNIQVFQPIKIRQDYEIIKEKNPDLIVTCAYGQILPQELLDIPKLGAINVHASLLPKYRGSAPIQWAMINGEKETGVTLMYMDAGMDTGDMITKASCSIDKDDNVGTLHDKLSILGANLLNENLLNIINKKVDRIKQDDNEATYAPMIKREDEHLNFDELGLNVINRIKALNPWPLSYFILEGQEIKVIDAEFIPKENCKPATISEVTKRTFGIDVNDGTIYLKTIKPFGKKIMNVNDYLNGINKDNILGKKVM